MRQNFKRIAPFIVSLVVFSGTAWAASESLHSDKTDLSSGTGFFEFVSELSDGFDYLFKTVGSGSILESDIPEPEGTKQYSATGELRPDFYLNYRKLNFFIKPRGSISHYWVEKEASDEEEIFINEWQAGFTPIDELHFSFGRENLQWGPSYLFSPSNPFFQDNGQTRPLSEIRGMDFAKAIWTPNTAFSFSFLANTDDGEQTFPFGFQPTYAGKMDLVANRGYASIIFSKREKDRPQLGGYFGWTLSDAFILHGEWKLFYELASDYKLAQWYQILQPEPVSGIDDDDKYTDDIQGIGLIGGSYTFITGTNVTVEYVYNGEGFSDLQAGKLIEALNLALSKKGQTEALFLGGSENTTIPESTLLRKNYVMGQIGQTQIKDRFNITLRYLYNLDDYSGRAIGILSCDIGNYIRLFLNGRKNFGPDDSEFNLLYDYSVLLGIEITY